MKLILSLVAGIMVAVSAASPSAAEPVPEHATGIWSAAECGENGLTVLMDANAALTFETREEQVAVAVAQAEWLAGSVVLTVEGEEGELVLPPLDSLHRCDALPVGFSIIFAESVTVFREIDKFKARCASDEASAAQCVALVFELIDVSKDGVFSKAELSRAVRAASFFVGYWVSVEESQDPFVPVETLSVAWFAASVLGPFVAANLIDSYDFDGDGRLSPTELLQDRSLDEGIQGLAANAPHEIMSGLMRTLSGLLEALR